MRRYYGDDPNQFGELRLPDRAGPSPVLVLVHGGFWRARYGLELMDDMAEYFRSRGYVTWNLEYRRVGQPGGGWPGTVQDVSRGLDHLSRIADEVALDLGRVGIIGHSAGGHLALLQAKKARDGMSLALSGQGSGSDTATIVPTAVIALAAVSDLVQMHASRLDDSPVAAFLGGAPEDAPDACQLASPIDCLPLGVRQLLVHGTADANVPYGQSSLYAKAADAAGDPVELLTLDGVDHFAIIEPGSAIWEDIVRAVERLIPV